MDPDRPSLEVMRAAYANSGNTLTGLAEWLRRRAAAHGAEPLVETEKLPLVASASIYP
jgi:hypothetical protein